MKDRLDTMMEFTSILKRLIDNYILLVPTTTAPGTRLKMRYYLDVPIKFILDAPPKEGLAEQLGWRRTRMDFWLGAAVETEIYHFEVEDPPGVDLAMASIWEYPEELPGGTIREPIIHDWQPGGLPRLNLRARGVQRGSLVVARVDFRSSRHGWLPAFAFCSWAMALLLAISAWRLPYILTLGERITGANPVGVLGIVAAVLIFLGGSIAILLTKFDEHGLARLMLSRLRQLAFLTAALPAIAVAGLLFIPPGPPLRWTWLGLAVTALLSAVLSTFSYLLPQPPKALPLCIPDTWTS